MVLKYNERDEDGLIIYNYLNNCLLTEPTLPLINNLQVSAVCVKKHQLH